MTPLKEIDHPLSTINNLFVSRDILQPMVLYLSVRDFYYKVVEHVIYSSLLLQQKCELVQIQIELATVEGRVYADFFIFESYWQHFENFIDLKQTVVIYRLTATMISYCQGQGVYHWNQSLDLYISVFQDALMQKAPLI